MIDCSCCLSAKNVTVSHDILIIPDRLVSDPSAVNLKNSTREDREEINCNDQKVKGESIKKVAEQSALINKMIDKKGVNVSKDQHELLKNAMENHLLKLDDNTPLSLLRSQIKELASKKNS